MATKKSFVKNISWNNHPPTEKDFPILILIYSMGSEKIYTDILSADIIKTDSRPNFSQITFGTEYVWKSLFDLMVRHEI